MPPPNEKTHAFVVRFWCEPRTLEDADPIWRGVVEHVPTGQRYYVKEVNELVLFFVEQLRLMGVALAWSWRIWAWWQLRQNERLRLSPGRAEQDT